MLFPFLLESKILAEMHGLYMYITYNVYIHMYIHVRVIHTCSFAAVVGADL